jgi:hypothetical protein
VPKINTLAKSALTPWQRLGVLTETGYVTGDSQPLQATRSNGIVVNVTHVWHDTEESKVEGGHSC